MRIQSFSIGDAANFAQRGDIDDVTLRHAFTQRRIEIRSPARIFPPDEASTDNRFVQSFRPEIQRLIPPQLPSPRALQLLYTMDEVCTAATSRGKQASHGLGAKIENLLYISSHRELCARSHPTIRKEAHK